MNTSGNKSIFIDNDKDETRWDRLADILKNYDPKMMKKISKQIKKQTSREDRDKLLVFLQAMFMETDLVKWELIKKRITSYENKINKNNTGFFSFKKTDESEQSSNEQSDFAEMFINIGKDKKVYPRDLINFIKGSMKISHTEIRGIKIFDKYSFFQIPEDMAEKASILLSVKRFRGKKIAVNRSNKQR